VRRWTTKDLADLVDFYWDELAPAMRADGYDPEREHPPYSWVVERGFSGFITCLRRDHDLTPGEFYESEVGVRDRDDYWRIDHGPTRTALERYVHELRERRGHPETTVVPIRSRLSKYVEVYADLHGGADLLSGLTDVDGRPTEIDRALAVFDVLDRLLGSERSKLKYLEDTRRFYRYLIDAGRATYNPLERMEARFAWERPEPDNPALRAPHVRSMYEATRTSTERLLVVGLAGWGLRPSELCSLRTEQVELSPADGYPYLEFAAGERKNGPGTVSVLVGADELADRLATLSNDPGWNGHLFPSSRSASGHIVTDTVRSRFGAVAERAGVTVDGRRPTPRMGRRFWYSTYGDAIRTIAKRFDDVAADQGSESTEVVLRNYLSEDERRKHRRDAMHDTLRRVFGDGSDGEAGTDPSTGDY
jgi:integrase